MNVTFANDIAIAVVFYITGWMLRTYLTHRENMKGLSITKQGLASSDQRLARVEQAVESIAIEVERISEGQRYVTMRVDDLAAKGVEVFDKKNVRRGYRRAAYEAPLVERHGECPGVTLKR